MATTRRQNGAITEDLNGITLAAGKSLTTGAAGVPELITIGGADACAVAVTIADDAVATLAMGRTGGFLFITAGGTSTTTIEAISGLVFFDAGTTPAISKQTFAGIAASLDVTTGVLTGTTGTNGNVTISPQSDGTIQIENRRGGVVEFSVVIL